MILTGNIPQSRPDPYVIANFGAESGMPASIAGKNPATPITIRMIPLIKEKYFKLMSKPPLKVVSSLARCVPDAGKKNGARFSGARFSSVIATKTVGEEIIERDVFLPNKATLWQFPTAVDIEHRRNAGCGRDLNRSPMLVLNRGIVDLLAV